MPRRQPALTCHSPTLLGREPNWPRFASCSPPRGFDSSPRRIRRRGKTRIALELLDEVASTFVDGVWFVDLSAVREPNDVLGTIAQSLGVREQPGTPIGERLARVLVDRKALVVLDNFEQVIDAARRRRVAAAGDARPLDAGHEPQPSPRRRRTHCRGRTASALTRRAHSSSNALVRCGRTSVGLGRRGRGD